MGVKCMKKILAFLLMMVMMLSLAAASGAEPDLTEMIIANGTLQAAEHVDITAPFSGTLRPFSIETGDRVQAGDELFSFLVQTLYAPEDGEITAVFAQPGAYANDVSTRYGSLAAIEPVHQQKIEASTTGAYNKNANKEIRVGETLYFRTTEGRREDGEGVVRTVWGSSFKVEIIKGTFDYNTNLTLYRNDSYTNESKVGTGYVQRKDPVTMYGNGLIETVFVQKGDTVHAQDRIMTLLPPDADPGAASTISAPAEGVISVIPVSSGQQVWKGAWLARIERTDKMEVVAEIDEMDLSKVSVGATLPITFDVDPSRVIYGTVTEVSRLGITKQNAAYYQAHLSVSVTDIPIGASADVYLPRK